MSNFLSYFEDIVWYGGQSSAIFNYHQNARIRKGSWPGMPYRTEAEKISLSIVYFTFVFEDEVKKICNEVREIFNTLESDVKKFSYISQTLNRIETMIRDCEENKMRITTDFNVRNEEEHLQSAILSALENLDERLRREYIKFPLPFKDAEMYENQNSHQTKPEFERILSEIKGSENRFWIGLPMVQVVKHFEVMTIKSSKNGKPYLTEEQFISFLKKGFLNDSSQPKQKINCSPGEKGLVIKRFYDFFDLAITKYSHPQKKAKFISLFVDCFDNWKQKTVESLFRPNKTKQTW